MKLLLVNNHSILNVGDHAILAETLRMLEAGIPGAEIALTFNDLASAAPLYPGYQLYPSPLTWLTRPAADGHTTVARPRWQQLLLIALLLVAALASRLTGRVPRVFRDPARNELVRAFATADVVLACGGGYIYAPAAHDGVLGPFNLRLINCALALALGKPLILLPQSIGPLHDSAQRRVARWVVGRAALTFVRERESLRLLDQLGVARRALYAPDLAFGMCSASELAADIRERVRAAHLAPAYRVGMTAINWREQSGAFAGQQRYEQALVHCIDAITGDGGVVVLFSQCCGPAAVEDDRLVNHRLRAQVRDPERVVLVDTLLDPAELQRAYAEMDYFVGTRMHSVILALNAGVPSIAIGYLHKTRGVLATLGLTAWCGDIERLTGAELVDLLAQLRRPGAQPGVASYLSHARRAKRAIPALLQAAVQTR